MSVEFFVNCYLTDIFHRNWIANILIAIWFYCRCKCIDRYWPHANTEHPIIKRHNAISCRHFHFHIARWLSIRFELKFSKSTQKWNFAAVVKDWKRILFDHCTVTIQAELLEYHIPTKMGPLYFTNLLRWLCRNSNRRIR